MVQTVNTVPQSKAHATPPLLERLRRVLERFLQSQKNTKKSTNKGLLALLQFLRQYRMGAGDVPLGMRQPVLPVAYPVLGEALPVFVARAGGGVRHKAGAVLQNIPSVSRRIVLVSSTVQVAAEGNLQVTQHSKPYQHKPQNAVDLLARRPFSMPSVRAPRGRRSMLRIQAERKGASVATPISAHPAPVWRKGVTHNTKSLEITGGLERILVHERGFQSVPKQVVCGGSFTSQRVAVPDKAQPVARSMVGAFLPSSPLMRAAVQPVVAVARPAPAAYAPQTPARAFALPSSRPAPMPPRVAMQGPGRGDSATLAALSTLGSI